MRAAYPRLLTAHVMGLAQHLEAVVSKPGVQAPGTTSASMAEQQRELKVQRERNSRLCDELRDERAMVGKLKGKLARREAEMRAEAAAASAAAQERVRFARASRVLASAEGRSSTGARSATLSSEVRSGSAISSAYDLSALFRTRNSAAATYASVGVATTHTCALQVSAAENDRARANAEASQCQDKLAQSKHSAESQLAAARRRERAASDQLEAARASEQDACARVDDMQRREQQASSHARAVAAELAVAREQIVDLREAVRSSKSAFASLALLACTWRLVVQPGDLPVL